MSRFALNLSWLSRLALVAGLALTAAPLILSGPRPALAAESLPAPTGPVLLRVSGTIAVTNTAKGAAFDLAMLEEMPKVQFKTTTIWTEGEQSFTGVALKDVLDRLGAKGKTLKATATNDYAVKIPVSDAVAGGPIIAYLNNGKPMSLRDKGPLWIVYPYDAKPAYQTEVIYSRSIWQLDRLEVTE